MEREFPNEAVWRPFTDVAIAAVARPTRYWPRGRGAFLAFGAGGRGAHGGAPGGEQAARGAGREVGRERGEQRSVYRRARRTRARPSRREPRVLVTVCARAPRAPWASAEAELVSRMCVCVWCLCVAETQTEGDE